MIGSCWLMRFLTRCRYFPTIHFTSYNLVSYSDKLKDVDHLFDIELAHVIGAYGSVINQTYTRVLNPTPVGRSRTISSIQHARGDVGMDDWPGLRHAINGTGATDQLFAYKDDVGQTYFRDIAAKNDGWVKDNVWGTLKDANPPVPRGQIWGPDGGPGFRRMLGRYGR
jgi:hypothetical protein